jgi:phosphohistidine phosphatase
MDTIATPQALLKAAGWPYGEGTVVVVGHQPTLGAAAALALTGAAAAWTFKKGAIWWLAQHRRDEEVLVRVAIAPDML